MRARLIFTFFVALFVSTSAMYANSLDWGDIALDGEFSDYGSRSVIENPSASVENNVVSIQFFEGMKDITITVKNDGGDVVYSTSAVASATTPGVSFSVAGYAPGTYLLELTNSNGGYVYGPFTLK